MKKNAYFVKVPSLWDCTGGKADHHWHVLPKVQANADMWVLREGTRCADNTDILLRMQWQRAPRVIKLWLLAKVTWNQGKNLLRPIDSGVYSSPTQELRVHTSVILVSFCPNLFHLGKATASLYSANTFTLVMLSPHQSHWVLFFVFPEINIIHVLSDFKTCFCL